MTTFQWGRITCAIMRLYRWSVSLLRAGHKRFPPPARRQYQLQTRQPCTGSAATTDLSVVRECREASQLPDSMGCFRTYEHGPWRGCAGTLDESSDRIKLPVPRTAPSDSAQDFRVAAFWIGAALVAGVVANGLAIACAMASRSIS